MTDTFTARVARQLTRVAAVMVVILGVVVLAAWMTHPIAAAVLPGLTSMKANASVAMVAAGMGLALWHRAPRTRSPLTFALAVPVLLIAILTLYEYAFGADLHFDQILFRDPARVGYPGRMAHITALNFLMIGLALTSLARQKIIAAQLLALLPIFSSLLAFVGYLYGQPLLYGTANQTAMALHTVVAFLLLGTGILFADPSHGVGYVICSEGNAGWMARSLLPFAVVVPILLGWIFIHPRFNYGLPNLGIALTVVVNIFFFVILIWFQSRQLYSADLYQKKTQAALLESERLASAGRLSATIAHEINNPLMAITTATYLLESLPLDPATHTLVLQIKDETERVAHIIEQTLGAFKETHAPEPVDLHHAIDDALHLLEKKAATGLRFEKNFGEPRQITTFPGELRQILTNLISNAMDAAGSGGQVRITTHPERWGARISISDSGPGVPREMLTTIFEPFISTKGDKGNGLGLWVTKNLVKKMGGQIEVVRDPSMAGATFTFYLPDASQAP